MRSATYALLSAIVVSVASASAALAADLPVKAPFYKAPPPLAYNWTGFYLGGHAGYGWSHTDQTNITGNSSFPAGYEDTADQKGWLGGVQVGFNYQFPSNWVVGVEGEFSWGKVDGDFTEVSPVTPATRVTYSTTKTDWLATATGRLGYAYDNWLFYAKGGAAWARKETTASTVDPSLGGTLTAITGGDVTRFGWTAGGGVEWGFWQNWSAKLEYDYLDFGSATETRAASYYNGTTGLDPLLRDVDFHMSVVKLGVNYRFDWMR